MDKSLIDKYKTDESWSEVIKLYSGLFDTPEERFTFIKDISDINTYLAAQCSTACLNKDNELDNEIIRKAQPRLENLYNNGNYYSGLVSLNTMVELEEYSKILPYYEFCDGKIVPYLKSIIPNILNNARKHHNEILKTILNKKASYYISNIIEYYSNSLITIDKEIFIEIISTLISSNNYKPKKIIEFIKLWKGIEIDIEKCDLRKLLYSIDTIEDFLFLSGKFGLIENYLDFIYNKINYKISLKESFMIFCIINLNKNKLRNVLNTIIKKLIISSDKNCFVLGLFLILSYNLMNNFRNELPNEKFSLLFLIGSFDSLTSEDIFYERSRLIIRKLQENEIKSKIDSYVGMKFNCRILSKWKYHYVTTSPSGISNSSLLPICETNLELNINDEIKVIIVHVDSKSLRLYTSQKQIDKDKDCLFFNMKFLEIIKKGDIISCKVNKGDKIRLVPIGMGKSLKCILAKNNQEFDCNIYKQEFIVQEVIKPFLIKVIPFK